MYIIFEGLDGAGKDTQLQKTYAYLSDKFKYMNLLKTQEPSGISQKGKEISYKLQNGGFSSPNEALSLYIEDRVEMNEIKKCNLDYGVVLCSRGDYTTYAYQSIDQGDKKGFSFEEIYNKHRELENPDNPLLIPDLTFFFDLPIEETMRRITSRLKEGEKKDFFEKEDFLATARGQYLKSIEFLKEKEYRNIYIINANRSREEIFEEVKSILDKYIN